MKHLTFWAIFLLPGLLYGQILPNRSLNRISTAPFSIVITEIMADPEPSNGLPVAEYVEILNNSQFTINLGNWVLYDGSSRILPSISIDPGEYIIICANSDTTDFGSYGKCAGVSSISLTNGGEKVAIRDPLGFSVDSIIYSDSWYGSSYKKDGGWSLERVDADYTCTTTENWKPCENILGGTPGQINSISGAIIDNTPPLLLRAYCEDSVTVILVFNEPMDAASAMNIQNYSFSNSLSASTVSMSGENNERIVIKISEPIQTPLIYSVKVTGTTDCSGNILIPCSTRFGLADTVRLNEIVINEVLFDPFAGGYDFVELFNNGTHILDLKDLKIASIDLQTNEPDEIETITSESWLLFPGDYCVLTEMPDIVSQQYRSSFPYNFLKIGSLPAMNIDEGHICILASGVKIDEFRYTESYHFGLLNDTKGISLEKINPSIPSMDPSSWHSASTSGGFATPGLKNSQFSDLVSDDIAVSVTPEIFSPDNDGKDDFVMFSVTTGKGGYISNIQIYNASGQVIFSNNKNNFIATSEIFTWDGIDNSGNRAPVGIYMALVEFFNLTGDLKKYRLPLVLAVRFD